MAASQTAFDLSTQIKAKRKKWVVVGPGARDGYQIPIALCEAGLLERFFTDFYSPLDRFPFATVIPASIQKRVKCRFASELPSRFVESHTRYTLRTCRDPFGWSRHAHLIGEPAGRTAEKRCCGIVAYSHVATSAFEHSDSVAKILLQIQPHPISVRAALAKDRLRPDLADGSFNELNWPEDALRLYSREPLLAGLCIAASNYTRGTLIENGVTPKRIRVIPYGVDLDFFRPHYRPSGRFTVLFAGQLIRQKGVHYLLEAWRSLRLPGSELRIAGKLSRENQAFAREYGTEAVFLGTLNRHQLRSEYQRADLLCLPSLSEGFGHVVLEALACGTPALVTESCGACDLIESGRNGFIIPVDVNALSEKLEWAFHHRNHLAEMRFAARNTAEQHPWSKFRAAVIQALQSFSGPA